VGEAGIGLHFGADSAPIIGGYCAGDRHILRHGSERHLILSSVYFSPLIVGSSPLPCAVHFTAAK